MEVSPAKASSGEFGLAELNDPRLEGEGFGRGRLKSTIVPDRLTLLRAGDVVGDHAGSDGEAVLRGPDEVSFEAAARAAVWAVSSRDATSPALPFA